MIDARTEVYGIIGNPVRHSLSPVIHNGAFQRMGLNAAYLAFEVENLQEAVRGIKGMGIRGVSVTLPFKIEVIPYLDEVDKMAGRAKAVNTILNQEGRLVGYNTDWLGAINALEEKINLKGKKVLLLGAGGSAHAIGLGLMGSGCQLTIFNRSQKKAEALANWLGCGHLPVLSREKIDAEVIINSTPVGMFPCESESPFPKGFLTGGMTVMDVVYQPLKTKFLREAEELGCTTIDGLEMLSRQGAAQIEIWTGKKPELSEIKKDLCRVLGIETHQEKTID